jgi:hypothetical protein
LDSGSLSGIQNPKSKIQNTLWRPPFLDHREPVDASFCATVTVCLIDAAIERLPAVQPARLARAALQ